MRRKRPFLICFGYYLLVLYLCRYFKKYLEVTQLRFFFFFNVELNLSKYNKVDCLTFMYCSANTVPSNCKNV